MRPKFRSCDNCNVNKMFVFDGQLHETWRNKRFDQAHTPIDTLFFLVINDILRFYTWYYIFTAHKKNVKTAFNNTFILSLLHFYNLSVLRSKFAWIRVHSWRLRPNWVSLYWMRRKVWSRSIVTLWDQIWRWISDFFRDFFRKSWDFKWPNYTESSFFNKPSTFSTLQNSIEVFWKLNPATRNSKPIFRTKLWQLKFERCSTNFSLK